MKRICSLLTLLCVMMMALPLQSLMAAPTIGLFLDGKPLSSAAPPVLVGGRTLVPLRVVSEALGALVNWTSNSAPIVIRKGADEISLRVGVKTATRNGNTLTLDAAPQVVAGTTMVPLRFVGESLGVSVNWVASPPGVHITSPVGSLSQATTEQVNGQVATITFLSSTKISLGQAVPSDTGQSFTVNLSNVIAQAEQKSYPGPTGLLGYTVVPEADNKASITLTLGNDAAFRSPKAEVQADGKSLMISWPLTMKQVQFTQTGGVEYLSFGLPASVRPELTETEVESTAGGTLVGRVNADVGVKLRPGPSTAIEQICVVKYKEIVTIIGETTGWYQVRLSDGREGWMADPYVAVETVIEEKDGVNVRSGPGQTSVITVLRPGQKVTVLERQVGWYKVSYGTNQTGWIADWLVPLGSKLSQSSTIPGLRLFFPGVHREGELVGSIGLSEHVAALAWQESSQGSTATLQLKHAVGHRLAEVADGWRLTFGTWITDVQLVQSASGSTVRLSTDGQSQPTVAYVADSQVVVITVPYACLGQGVPTSLVGDGALVSKVQMSQVGSGVRVTVSLVRQTAYHLSKAGDSRWEVEFSSPTLVGKTIALDPGHGATDPGAMGTRGWNEKDFTADIANRVRALLQAAGAKVVMTREIQSGAIEGHGRAALINQSGADLFLSMHINSYTNRSVTGLETYYYPRNDNERFARLVQSELVGALGWPDRGVRSNTLYIITREALTTGVLAEIGYISNSHDEGELLRPEVRQTIAQSLYRAIERYFAD